MTEHILAAERLHYAWDNSLPPVLEVDPGDSVTIDTWDASGHVVQRSWTSTDAANRTPKPGVGHALTGPIAVHGARAGETLVVEVLDVACSDWVSLRLGQVGACWPTISARRICESGTCPTDASRAGSKVSGSRLVHSAA
jgi:acetamidase/formamidase